jgi:hypothetical protein
MLSKGKKREFYCPECGNIEIFGALIMGQKSYMCTSKTCNSWGPWSTRGNRKPIELKELPNG